MNGLFMNVTFITVFIVMCLAGLFLTLLIINGIKNRCKNKNFFS